MSAREELVKELEDAMVAWGAAYDDAVLAANADHWKDYAEAFAALADYDKENTK
jgi:hypothetical protein